MYGNCCPPVRSQVTTASGPADEVQTTSSDSPGFKNDRDGSKRKSGNFSPAKRLFIRKNKFILIFFFWLIKFFLRIFFFFFPLFLSFYSLICVLKLTPNKITNIVKTFKINKKKQIFFFFGKPLN